MVKAKLVTRCGCVGWMEVDDKHLPGIVSRALLPSLSEDKSYGPNDPIDFEAEEKPTFLVRRFKLVKRNPPEYLEELE